MQISFTEYREHDPEFNKDPALKYGGFVTVRAESLADTSRIVDYFNIHDGKDPESLISRALTLQNRNLVHHHRPKKRPYFEVNGSLDVKLFQPYLDWAKKVFRYDGPFPNLSIPFKWDGLQYVFVGIKQEIQCHETVCYTVAIQAEKWNNRTGQENAIRNAHRYIAESFGHVEPIREYLPNENGTYRRNPDYATGKRNPVVPSCTNKILMKQFADWWLEHAANDEQRKVLTQNEELVKRCGEYSRVNWLTNAGCYYVDTLGSIDYNGKGLMVSYISFNDFAALGS